MCSLVCWRYESPRSFEDGSVTIWPSKNSPSQCQSGNDAG
jgi:hypothetical protein